LNNPVATAAMAAPPLLALQQVETLAGLRTWWRTRISSKISHDCAVVGEAEPVNGMLKVTSIVIHWGGLHGEVSDLVDKCSRLLMAWSLMEEPCEIDLGACDCVGERATLGDRPGSRRFLIHGTRHGATFAFVLLSSTDWSDTEGLKTLLNGIIDPVAAACGRITERTLVLSTAGATAPQPALTAREQQIVAALGDGLTNKEIARILGLSPNTVRNQIAHLSSKVGARSRAQLALLARSPGTAASVGDDAGGVSSAAPFPSPRG
jgi:DNA-binding CsgD family transcriptional regulator